MYDYYETAAVDNAKSLWNNFSGPWGLDTDDPQMKRQAEKTLELAAKSWSARVNAAVKVARALGTKQFMM